MWLYTLGGGCEESVPSKRGDEKAKWPTLVRASLLTKPPVRRCHTRRSRPLAAYYSVLTLTLLPYLKKLF